MDDVNVLQQYAINSKEKQVSEFQLNAIDLIFFLKLLFLNDT